MRASALAVLLAATLLVRTSDAGQSLGPMFPITPLPKDETHKEIPPPKPPDVSQDVCAADVSEHDGIVKLSLEDEARAGAETTFSLDGLTYASRFDSGGRLNAEAPLLHAQADLAWTGRKGQRCSDAAVTFSGIQSAFFIALISNGDQNGLALHVVEPPDGRIGGDHNYVSLSHPNLGNGAAHGHLRTFGEPVEGTSQVQLYSLPSDRNTHDGLVYAFVEFASRGSPARPPFCGDDPRAVVSFKILHRDGNELNRVNSRFAAVPCGTAWTGDADDSGYYESWKWKM